MNSFFNKMLFVSILILYKTNKVTIAQITLGGSTNTFNTITTAVPYLRICPEARAGAMGDVGIATEPNANDNHWNVAKIVMNQKNMGTSFSYTPWLRDLMQSANLFFVSGYKKFGKNKDQAISTSLRYFSVRPIDWDPISLKELAFDVGYSKKINKNLSVGILLRYINVNNKFWTSSFSKPTNNLAYTIATDLGVFYNKPIKRNNNLENDFFNFGIAITNLGDKISYNFNQKELLPTNIGIGSTYIRKLKGNSSISLSLDINKLLVPSPQPVLDSQGQIIGQFVPQKSVIEGMITSLGDAPGGINEEFREFMWSFGSEFKYKNKYFARVGYFYEDKYKGNRKFVTVGGGFNYNIFTMNLAYILPKGSGMNRNPLSNTIRMSFLFNLQKFKKENKLKNNA